MKITDYAMRAAPFDSHIWGNHLKGIEIGVDVGAHAEAMLTHCRIDKLYLVDIWDKEYYRGYCEGRLNSKGFKHRVEYLQSSSKQAATKFKDQEFDFIYIDSVHDYDSVYRDLADWFPKLKTGGKLGYRNFTNADTPLDKAVKKFVKEKGVKFEIEYCEIILLK